MRKIINGLVSAARHKAAPDVANAAIGAGVGLFVAPTADRAWEGEEILPAAKIDFPHWGFVDL